jgi:DsbC/DsbD-like thiol-disulfide interchange protein
MKQKLVGLVFAAAIVIAAGLTVNAQSVTGSIANGTVTRGKAARATVYLSLPGGLHANSSRPGSEYAVPTTVRPSARGIRLGAVNYPRGKNRKFSFSNDTINVYEGRTAFTFTVTVPANYKGNTISVRVPVKYQACTDEVCYPPTTKTVNLTARVL